MDRNLPVEVMIKTIKDIQKFLIVNPAKNMEMSAVQLIMHGLIKLTKTGGLYAKAIELWNAKAITNRQNWVTFTTHFIEEYKKMLAAGGGTMVMNKEWGAGFNTGKDDGSLLVESIVQYAESSNQEYK